MGNASIYKSPAGESAVMALYDQALAYWPVPHEELRLPTRYGETFIIASGPAAAPPLVLLHGAASNALSWMGEVAAYSQRCRTYAVDIIGEPGRSAPARPSWNGPAYGEWLADVLDGLAVTKASLLGLSQGGWNALKFAVMYPERAARLVLLTPAGVTADRPSFLLRALAYSRLGRRGAAALNRYVFGGDSIDPAALAFMQTTMDNLRPRLERLRPFTDDELGRLAMPVLLLGGARDVIRDVAGIAARLGRFAPQLATRLYPARGHVLIGTAPDVMPFLRGGQ